MTTYEIKDRQVEELAIGEHLAGMRDDEETFDVSGGRRGVTETRRRCIRILGINIPIGKWQRVRYVERV